MSMSNISLLFLGGWCCYSRETCDSRYQNIPRLMSSSGWPQTKRGRSAGHVLKCMSDMFPVCCLFYIMLSDTEGHLSDLRLLDLQELEYCLLRLRKTHTGIMQTLCKSLHIPIECVVVV